MKRTLLILAVLLLGLIGAGGSMRGHDAQAQVFSGHCYPATSSLVIASATGISTSGGATIITGTGFPTLAPPAVMVCLDTVTSQAGCGANSWAPLAVTSYSATQITATAPALAAGTYDILISNRTCGSDFAASTLSVTATQDPIAVCTSSNLQFWYKADTGVTCGGSACSNGGLVDSWTDLSGHGHTLTASGTARPTFNSAATFVPAGMPSYPSVTFDGVNNLLKNTTIDVSSGTAFYMWFVGKDLAGTANKIWMGVYDAGTNRWALGTGGTANTPAVWSSSSISATFNSSITGAQQYYVGEFGASGSYSTNVSSQNGLAIIGSSAQTYTAGNGTISLGGTNTTAQANIEVVEAFGCNIHPSTSTLFTLAQYANLKWFNYAPKFYASTTMRNDGTGFRALGSGFVNGMTASFSGLGVSAQTAVVNSSTRADIPMPGTSLASGSWDLTLTNPDGGSITESSAFHTTSVATNSPMTVTGDLAAVAWYQLNGAAGSIANAANNYTIGTGVSDVLDQSLHGNDLHQGTTGSQPTFTSADTNYPLSGGGFANSMSFDGVAMVLPTTATNFSFGLTSPGFDIGATARFDASTALQVWLWDYNASTVSLEDFQAKPRNVAGGSTATWGTAIGATTHEMFIDHPAGASPTISVNVDNGTAVTQTTAVSALTDNQLARLGSRTTAANFYKGSLSCFAVYSRTLTGTEQTNLRTWMQANCGAP